MTTSKRYYLYLVIFLGLLSAFGPFVIDMYLPALPEMTEVFSCDASAVQLGLTFCMVGLAVGQLIFGPASDKYGRKPVLVFSLVIFVAASVVCCFSTSITAFTAARLLQGIGGAGGIVLSRSVAADMYSGRELAKLIAILSAINNLAPVAAPVAGGGIAHAWGWQGIFVILLVLGIVLLGMCVPLRESLHNVGTSLSDVSLVNTESRTNVPKERPYMAVLKGYREVMHIKGFVAYSIVYALAMAALFAYISATPFIVQDVFGFSELQFSLVFAVNAIALAAGSALSLRFASMSKAALCGSVIGGTLAVEGAMTVFFGLSAFIVYEIPTFVMLFGIGLVLTGSTSQAMNLGRDCAGAASAVIGGIGYIAGGLVSPLVSYGNISLTSFLWCAAFLLASLAITIHYKKSGKSVGG